MKSGFEVLRISSAGAFGLASLVVGAFLSIEAFAPLTWANAIGGLQYADARYFNPISTPLGVIPSVGLWGLAALVMGLFVLPSSVLKGRKMHLSKNKALVTLFSVALVGVFLAGAMMPTFAISATQTAEYNQFNNQPCTYYVFTDGTNYYGQDCSTGVIAYGGPTNAGGVSGANAGPVTQAAVNALGAKGGVVSLGNGVITGQTVVMSGSHVTLKGPSIVPLSSATVDIGNITISSASGAVSDITIANLFVNTLKFNAATSNPISQVNVDGVSVQKVTSANGISFVGGSYVNWVRFTDYNFYGTGAGPMVSNNITLVGAGQWFFTQGSYGHSSSSSGTFFQNNGQVNTVVVDGMTYDNSGASGTNYLVHTTTGSILQGFRMTNSWLELHVTATFLVVDSGTKQLSACFCGNSFSYGAAATLLNNQNALTSWAAGSNNTVSFTNNMNSGGVAPTVGTIGAQGSTSSGATRKEFFFFMTGNSILNQVAPSTVTAGSSVWTYTNLDGYDEVMQLSAANGISAESCNGLTGWSTTVGTSLCVLPPMGKMTVTWTVTAPTYTKVPLFG